MAVTCEPHPVLAPSQLSRGEKTTDVSGWFLSCSLSSQGLASWTSLESKLHIVPEMALPSPKMTDWRSWCWVP